MSNYIFNPVKVSRKVQKTDKILCVNNHFFIYKKNGVFLELEDAQIYKMVYDYLGEKYRERYGREVRHCLMTENFRRPDEVNAQRDMINIKNGMFCLKEMKVFPHSPDYLSTIQLPVIYKDNASCPLWEKTLDGIFIGKRWKIEMLQEFLGYCLTTDVSHQKALINYGQGANGKSLIFKVLQNILGKQNVSSVSMSGLEKNHYLAELFGKLVNISIESESDIKINDAVFKALVGGDAITADEKYGKPFSFNPFCKMIFSLNTLPYVSDKSSAFYRRVLLLSYEKEFSREEQNKNLYNELLKEIDGIFLWMTEGLKRLNERGYFTEDDEMIKLIDEYKRDNNTALSFIEDNIELKAGMRLTKKDIYSKYYSWCKGYGYKPASDKTLTKTLKKKYPNEIKETRTGFSRNWEGLTWVKEESVAQKAQQIWED